MLRITFTVKDSEEGCGVNVHFLSLHGTLVEWLYLLGNAQSMLETRLRKISPELAELVIAHAPETRDTATSERSLEIELPNGMEDDIRRSIEDHGMSTEGS